MKFCVSLNAVNTSTITPNFYFDLEMEENIVYELREEFEARDPTEAELDTLISIDLDDVNVNDQRLRNGEDIISLLNEKREAIRIKRNIDPLDRERFRAGIDLVDSYDIQSSEDLRAERSSHTIEVVKHIL
jgi:hypothetical protein